MISPCLLLAHFIRFFSAHVHTSHLSWSPVLDHSLSLQDRKAKIDDRIKGLLSLFLQVHGDGFTGAGCGAQAAAEASLRIYRSSLHNRDGTHGAALNAYHTPGALPGIHLCNMVIGGKTPLLPREELAKAGYAVICYANAALQASLLAMEQVLGHLGKSGSIAGIEDRFMMFAERQKMLDADRFKDLEKRYA